MPALRRFDVDELLTRPGTYFHPETEIVLVVDDSAHVDLELIEDEDEGAEWILLGDDPAVDEHKRDELVEAFETRRARSSAREDPDEDEVDDEPDPLHKDPGPGGTQIDGDVATAQLLQTDGHRRISREHCCY